MAIRYAVQNGNWSDTTTWDGGTLPTNADDVRSNSFVVTIDVNTLTTTPDSGETVVAFSYQVGKVTATKNGAPFTAFTATNGTSVTLDVAANGTDEYVFENAEWQVLSVGNIATGSATNGGLFKPANGSTLVCTASIGILPRNDLITPLCILSDLSSGSATIIGTVRNATFNNSATRDGYIIQNSSSGILNFIGNISYTAGNNKHIIIVNTGSGILNITAVGTINNSPFAFGGSIEGSIENRSIGTININGNFTSSNSNNTIIVNSSSGTINITGDATGGGNAVFINNSSGTINHIGVVQTTLFPAVSSGSASQNTYLTGPFIGTASGHQANAAIRWRWHPTATSSPSYMTAAINAEAGGGFRNLYTADTLDISGQPSPSDTRLGVAYGPDAEIIGTMAVPAPEFVSAGIAVDDTVGTAVTTGADLWNVSVDEIGAEGTIGERIKNTATIQSVGAQIEALGA